MRRGRRSWVAPVQALWQRALHEHSSPREIGWSVGLGAFAAMTPLVGLHLGLAAVLATLFRVNRLWAMVASRLSWAPILAVVAFSEIELAHRLRTATWAPLQLREVAVQGRELLLDWVLGTGIVAPPVAIFIGMLACSIASRVRRRGASPGKLAADLAPSSESTTSTPRAPTR